MTKAMQDDLREVLAQLDWDRYRQTVARFLPSIRGDAGTMLATMAADVYTEYSCATAEQKQASRGQADKTLAALQDLGVLEKA